MLPLKGKQTESDFSGLRGILLRLTRFTFSSKCKFQGKCLVVLHIVFLLCKMEYIINI